MQNTYQFIGEDGTFTLKNADEYSYLYFPVAGEKGLKSAVTPNLGGDSKLDQNTFILEPVSSENLHNNRGSRNFWCHMDGVGTWSATGVSAEEIAKKFSDDSEHTDVTAGFMWHTITRKSEKYALKTRVTSFVPVNENVEIMYVEIENTGEQAVTFTPTAAIPVYGRSADNIRDHRHVTSLLHRIKTLENGVAVRPTLSFDERGHQKNRMTFYVCGCDGKGNAPEDFYPNVPEYMGEGGNFEQPEAVIRNHKGQKAGVESSGCEAFGGLHFAPVTLEAGECTSYIVLMGVVEGENAKEAEQMIHSITEKYKSSEQVSRELSAVQNYWKEKVNVSFHTGRTGFDQYMRWVSFQPVLRRIYGCSFLPHHDYGKGGRGWRDLWQDCLALLIMNPSGVRQMLLDNFAGVRMDGTNATIIGNRQGEFIADRNQITRVWMDHGVWPFFTTKLYIDQTGDIELLDAFVPYFKDKQVKRGTAQDAEWNDAYGSWQKNGAGEIYKGSVLEHLLLQNLTAFYEVGEHNHIRLRGADWNDALDMADKRGESVAFTNAYAANLRDIAELLRVYMEKTGKETVEIAEEMELLLTDQASLYESRTEKQQLLDRYGDSCIHQISGKKKEIGIEALRKNLLHKANWMTEHIRRSEWVTDSEGNGWFNGYYDDHGVQVEGEFDRKVRMMLTSQVFAIMAGTAHPEQIQSIVKSADKYLYKKEVGGYRLNTDFGEVKMDLGRMFGFAYGEKENGAVFSHMAVMYANALYQRGFAKEGYRALNALFEQSADFETSRIYPGIPEYFNGKGRGLYHYLTGAASWYMLTVITEAFGVKGSIGDLVLEPKLMKEQFDENGNAKICLLFVGKKWNITYENKACKEYGEYRITEVYAGNENLQVTIAEDGSYAWIRKEEVDSMDGQKEHELHVILN